uniref:Uncharacterized protein n=1 Tax=Lactuca sativa TaxID=4236 RepID=A0A9R1WQ17_LACSA|nr:hypothetical protein LSAT_V11C100034040 [Lactuca sativa]
MANPSTLNASETALERYEKNTSIPIVWKLTECNQASVLECELSGHDVMNWIFDFVLNIKHGFPSRVMGMKDSCCVLFFSEFYVVGNDQIKEFLAALKHETKCKILKKQCDCKNARNFYEQLIELHGVYTLLKHIRNLVWIKNKAITCFGSRDEFGQEHTMAQYP